MKVGLKNLETLKRVVFEAKVANKLGNVTIVLFGTSNNQKTANDFTEMGFPTSVINNCCVTLVNNELVEFIQDECLTDVQKIKQLKKDSDEIIQRVKNLPPSREVSLSITKFQEAVMWMGMELKRRNEENPYPSSKDPSTGDKIEPTADGLKL